MVTRNTTTRDQHRRIIRRGEPPCGLCSSPIDYTIPYRTPDGSVNLDAYVVDHIIPLDRGGPDTLANKQAAHARCNRLKSNRLTEELIPAATAAPAEWVTSRRWW